MKKLMISLKRLSWALLLGGALLAGTAACSTGTSDGNVNVEESDFKDKSPTEHNAQGTSDNTEETGERPVPGAMTSDTAYEEVYDKQEKQLRDKNKNTNSGNGAGGAAGQGSTGTTGR